jgi:hypothetical protein
MKLIIRSIYDLPRQKDPGQVSCSIGGFFIDSVRHDEYRITQKGVCQQEYGVVSKQVSSASQIADKALGPPRTLPLSLQAPGPARTLYKAVSATRECPGLSPVVKVGDLADTRKQIRHDAYAPFQQRPY